MILSLCLHAHQPAGNFVGVFRSALQRCYEPFLAALEQAPRMRVSLHYSGPLLEWLEVNAPDHLRCLRRLVERGQVEMVTAGLYEPMLLLIPSHDRVAQVRAHRVLLRRLFGVDATVAWLTERAWEPTLAADLVRAGVSAVPLDDQHLFAAGLLRNDLGGPYLTESDGHPLLLVPASGELRYAVPWRPVSQTMALLRRHAVAGTEVLTYADDLEKFGLWPKTYEIVYRRGWLTRFFEEVSAGEGAAEVAPLGEVAAQVEPRGLIYVPDGSYPEFLEWSLPAGTQRAYRALRRRLQQAHLWESTAPFLRPGTPRQFLSRYPEVNHLHKRMLEVSQRLAPTVAALDDAELDPRRLPEAVRELWLAQGNCAYWHGLFGGVYLPHLRQALFQYLLRAERALEQSSGAPLPLVRLSDLDTDRREEVVLTNADLVLVVDPHEGGVGIELSVRKAAVNLGATLARRPEPYHRGERASLAYDRERRALFVDRFLPAGPLPAAWREVVDRGTFAGRPYACTVRETARGARADLTREGEMPGGRLRIEKRIEMPRRGARVRVRYRLQAVEGTIEGRFAPECNFALFFTEHPSGRWRLDGRPLPLTRAGRGRSVERTEIVLDEPPLAIEMEFDPPADVLVRPIETVSRSEGGWERIPQCLAVVPTWPMRLRAGECFSVELRLNVRSGRSPRR